MTISTKRSLKLKEDRKKIVESQRQITGTAESRENRRMTIDEATEWQRLQNDYKAISTEIEIAETDENRSINDFVNTNATNNVNERASEDYPFENIRDLMIAVRNNATRVSRDDRLDNLRALMGQNETNPSDGGFLVKPEFLGIQEKDIFDNSQLMKMVQKRNTSSNRVYWNQIKGNSRVRGSRNGGALAYWLSEGDPLTRTQIAYEQKNLELNKIGALYYASEESLRDAPFLESDVASCVLDELAVTVDEAIIDGNGAGRPLGIMNSPALKTVSKELNQTADTLVFGNIQKMRMSMTAKNRAQAVWLINQDCEAQLESMALVVGTGGVPVYMPASGISTTGYSTLYGRPVMPCEHMKTLGDAGDIMFADMSQYRIITNGGIRKDVSIHVEFATDQQAFRFIWRVGGMPLLDSLQTPKNGSLTTSAYVILEARA